MEPSPAPLLLHAIARGAACETNNDHRSEFTREALPAAKAFRAVAIFLRAGKKCRAVDGPATLAANPRESLPSFSFRASVALAATLAPG